MKKLYKSKSTKIVITLLFFIFALFYLSTIAYSAFSSTMNITGIGYSRVEADVRITDFKIDETSSNSISAYEEFSKNTLSANVTLPTEQDYIVYKIEVTNYGTSDIGIYKITGLNDLKYELLNYNIKDKICDNNGKCNNLSKSEIFIKISGPIFNIDINLTFEFRAFCKITYKNIEGNYPTEVMYGDNIRIDFVNDLINYAFVSKGNVSNYFYHDGILDIYEVLDSIEISTLTSENYEYSYTGNYQTFEVPFDGIYSIELWGSSGGTGYSTYLTADYCKGGLGAYTSGEIRLQKGDTLYVYVGGEGTSTRTDKTYIGFNQGGYNGGNTGRSHNNGNEYVHNGAGGGGATDIRLVSGAWNNTDSLKSRIMVAAGGGGGGGHNGREYGGAAGGLTSESRKSQSWDTSGGATQESGGKADSGYSANSGTFGIGGSCASNYSGGGGGGGYYGGAGGYWSPGTGGSSFISGHEGCNAINKNGTHSQNSLHYSNIAFTNTKMVDGNGYLWTTEKKELTGMPTYDGNSTMTGNTGNGYAKIKLKEILIKDNIHISLVNQITSNNNSKIINVNDTKFSSEIQLEQNLTSEVTYQITIFNPTDINYEFEYIEVEEYSNKNITYKLTGLNVADIVKSQEKKIFNITFHYKDEADISKNKLLSSLNFIFKKQLLKEFNYIGNYQKYVVPVTGTYKIELWGASGGTGYSTYTINDYSLGGNGAYTSGNITLTKNSILYIYVGGAGTSTRTDKSYLGTNAGGYNGGGTGRSYHNENSYIHNGAGGGGATDIRCFIDLNNQCNESSELSPNNTQGLRSRIMIAAGGGGGGGHNGRLLGTSGGGLTSNDSQSLNWDESKGSGQTYGGKAEKTESSIIAQSGSFGIGGNCASKYAGGGGYYGGAGGGWSAGTGGSSFISGHNGCDAINSSGNHTGQSIHYNNYKFINTVMIDGDGYFWTTSKENQTGMPTQDGTSTMTGNTGNGYAKITLIEVT